MKVYVDDPKALKCALKQKPLILYGVGTIGRSIAQWCDSQSIEYIFADRNAVEKQKLTQTTVITLEALKSDYKDANIVVSTNLFFDEIKNELLQAGFSQEQILSYTLFVPQNVTWRDLEDNIDWSIMRPSVELFSRWIPETTRVVADYGAGQMYLKTFLCPEITYYPIDYVKRFDETIVCDLNTGMFPDLRADVSVLNGVLEFLNTAKELLKYVCSRTAKRIIISYMTVDKFPSQVARRSSGYVSDLTETQIISLLDAGGFCLIQQEADPLNNMDSIYLFEKKTAHD